jgi:hypothetical protein
MGNYSLFEMRALCRFVRQSCGPWKMKTFSTETLQNAQGETGKIDDAPQIHGKTGGKSSSTESMGAEPRQAEQRLRESAFIEKLEIAVSTFDAANLVGGPRNEFL